MQKTQPFTLSADGALHLSLPRSWADMTQEQLRYALFVTSCGLYTSVEARTLMLVRFTGLQVLKERRYGWECRLTVVSEDGEKRVHPLFLQTWQVEAMIKQLDYVDSYETFSVRLESVGGFKAVDGLLHGVRFVDYLNMEKYYQGYISTNEVRYAAGLARLLYPGVENVSDAAEISNCVMWFSYVKLRFSKFFRHFFRPAPVAKGRTVDWIEQMNAQVRALTGGDITKEQAVFDKDCWRALTELDAKAREAEEFRRKYPK